MLKSKCRKGQAVVEMLVFGGLILLVFGFLLSFMQRMNDQQYIQMETFRRTLEKAHPSVENENPGASVRLTNFQHRRSVDVSGPMGKGSRQAFSASSSINWAIPKAQEAPRNLTVLKVNDDEQEIENKPVRVGDIKVGDDYTAFSETDVRRETPTGIVTERSSRLKDTITTTFVDDKGAELWKVTQGAYRDDEGQYRYKEDKAGTEIIRGKKWETGF